MGDPVHYSTSCSAVPAVHSDMPVWYGALYCTSPDLLTMYTVHHIATAGPTGTHNRTHQQVLVLCPMGILVIPQCNVVQYSILLALHTSTMHSYLGLQDTIPTDTTYHRYTV